MRFLEKVKNRDRMKLKSWVLTFRLLTSCEMLADYMNFVRLCVLMLKKKKMRRCYGLNYVPPKDVKSPNPQYI